MKIPVTTARTTKASTTARTATGVASLLAMVMGLTLFAAACGGHGKSGEGAAAAPALAPVTATLATAEARELPGRTELYGAVEADKSASVSSRVMATVVAVPVKAGDTVAAGQLLVEIDPQTAKGQEAQARGALAQAKAGLSLAERNWQRFQALAKSNSASELELDMARMQVEQARGAVEQAQGAVEAASSVAKEARVAAPFAGRVARRMVDPGDLAAPGRPLVVVESLSGRRLSISVPESLAASSKLATGRTLSVTIDSLPGMKELKGTVVEIAPGSDPASHTVFAKVEISGAGLAPVPTGYTGRALLETAPRRTVTVPAAAVKSQGGISLVVLRDAEGKARSRAVSVGEPLPGGSVEILSGLAGGETVLVGLASLPADGTPVSGPAGVASAGGPSAPGPAAPAGTKR